MVRSAALCLLLVGLAAQARAETAYIRDEIRVNMRSGPGAEFRILRVLRSGAQLERLAARDGWVRVRTGDQGSGWIPSRFLTDEAPPSVALPEITARLERAEARVQELEARLAAQSGALEELGALRARAVVLEQENRRLTWADTWRKWLTGAGIAAVFLLVGGLWPSSAQRSRKIRL